MAKKDTPRSMLQAFIENVPTTAPVKRTRARTRSPEDRHFNETVPNQKKRRRSSLAVKQTPRSMIESYMHDHKTQTPFVRVLRRRSKTFTPITESGDRSDVITPRTALEGFINNAPEETPVQRAVNESELDSESDIILPNETLHVTHSPIHNEDTGSITTSQKQRQNQHHITLQQFTQGMHNLTSAANQTKERMFSSDSEDTPEIPPDVTLDVLVDSLNSESDRSHMRMPQQDRRQNLNHITLEQFSQGLKEKIGSGSDAGVMGDDETEEEHSDIQTFRRGQRMSSRLSMGSLHTQVLERSMNNRSYLSPGKTMPQDFGDLTPSRRTPVRSPMVSLPIESNLTPSRRNLTPDKSKVDSVFIERNFTPSKSIQNIKLTTDSDLTPSKRHLSLKESLLNQTDLTPSQRTSNLNRSKVVQAPYESDFSPPSRTQIYSESALTPSRRTQIISESDLTPSQRTQIISESDLTPSRRTQIVSEPDLTPSRRSQIVSRSSTLHEHEELTPYRKTLSKNSISSNVESNLTPSRRTENPNRSTTFQSPKTSDLTPSRRTENLHKSTTLQSPDKSGLTPSRRSNTLDTSSSVYPTESNATLSRTMPTNTPMEPVKTNESSQDESGETDESLQGESGETDEPLQGESGETELSLSQTADKPVSHEESDKSGLTQSRIGTSQNRQMKDHGQTPSHRSPEKALDSVMPSSDTSQKNNQKSQNRTKDILMFEQVEQDSTDEKTPRSQIRSQSKLKPPIRTPLSSNLTILENIKPLSSSTPARILINKQIGTPSRVPVTPSSGSTPKRVPMIGSSMNRTPGRIPVKNSSMNISNNAKLSGTINKSVKNQSYLGGNMTNSALPSTNSSLRKLSHKSVNVSRQVSERLEADESEEETGEEFDTIELYKLKTPHLRGDISQIPTPIYSSTPAPVKPVQKQQPRPIPQSKQDTKKRKKTVSSVLPNNTIKQAFQHFCNMKAAPDTMEELIKYTDTYFENTFKTLEAFALHAGRKTIDESDVELLMRRQGFITEKQPLNVLVENILPLELRQEIIPMARANNVIEPL
ncbi:serine/arginine repetitive matrix protein 2-like isoform X2 [Mytilus californianus]|uniref:serine/arginine repetitive matrix protein 2-like isoform X2 n=1 Tax=Mytilus californianus TaxID=6549 RepID=UPI002247629E|nr:serine/arginine repetitive matrix protein 2-like isoform X2 [Mytilus californianus]